MHPARARPEALRPTCGPYGIADIATAGWAAAMPRFGIAPTSFPNVSKWLDLIAARPAVQRARALKPQ